MREILPDPEKLYQQLINHYEILTTLRIHQVQDDQGGTVTERLEIIPTAEASSKNLERLKDYMAKKTFFAIIALVTLLFVYLFLSA
jgi:hypothetical protein